MNSVVKSLLATIILLIVVASLVLYLSPYYLGEQVYERNVKGSLASFTTYTELISFLRENSGLGIVFTRYYSPGPIFLSSEASLLRAAAESLSATYATKSSADVYYSKTNVQVQGVDEPDIVKTDGYYIYYARQDVVYIARVYPVDEAGSVAKINVTKDLGYPRTTSPYKLFIEGLFLDKDKLIVIAATRTVSIYLVKSYLEPMVVPRILTYCILYDVSNRSNPRVIKYSEIEGAYYTARYLNNTIYLLTRKYIDYSSDPDTWIPLFNGQYIPPNKIYRLITPYGGFYNVYTIVYMMNTTSLEENIEAILMPYASRVYVSLNNIYFISQRATRIEIYKDTIEKLVEIISEMKGLLSPLDPETALEIYDKMSFEEKQEIREAIRSYLLEKYLNKSVDRTLIIKFGLNGIDISYIGRTEVNGIVTDQFSMDEYKGYFRIATTANIVSNIIVKESRTFGRDKIKTYVYPRVELISVNNVYVLDKDLSIIGYIEGIEPGERIHSTRFIGDMCFLVTFRRIDPLYAIDLSDPSKPRILGYLKVLGFSEYLHPINNSLLLGIGFEATKTGRIIGLKISLFNISDPTNITELSRIVYSGGDTPVIYNYRVFVYNTMYNYIMFPAILDPVNTTKSIRVGRLVPYYIKPAYNSGVLVIDIRDNKLVERCFIILEENIRENIRGLFVDKYIIVVGGIYVAIIDYETLSVIQEFSLDIITSSQ